MRRILKRLEVVPDEWRLFGEDPSTVLATPMRDRTAGRTEEGHRRVAGTFRSPRCASVPSERLRVWPTCCPAGSSLLLSFLASVKVAVSARASASRPRDMFTGELRAVGGRGQTGPDLPVGPLWSRCLRAARLGKSSKRPCARSNATTLLISRLNPWPRSNSSSFHAAG